MARLGKWAALGALAVALTGCQAKTASGPTTSETTAMALEQLRGLPSLEDTTAAVRTAVDQIAAEAVRLVPGLRWADPQPDATEACGKPYEQTGGQHTALAERVAAEAAVSPQQWAQIEQAARRAAANAGAPTAMMVPPPPGGRSATFIGQAGMSITVGYTGALTITGQTGCRLPAEAK